MEIPVNKNNIEAGRFAPARLNLLVGLVLTLCGILAGYFATIYEIRLELVGKAENGAVISLEKRVLSLEIYLREVLISREDWAEFKRTLESKIDNLSCRDR